MNIVMRDTSFGVYIFNFKININTVIRVRNNVAQTSCPIPRIP